MSILNDLAIFGADFAKTNVIDVKSSEWFDKLIASTKKVADGLNGDAKTTANISIDILNKHKNSILHLGERGITAFIGYIALGSEEKASQLLFLAKEATLDDLLAAGKASNLNIIITKKSEDESKAALIQILKDIGVTVAKTLLPILIAVI